jgi:putative FmdB family regulatory protein
MKPMPIYEYHCQHCDATFDKRRRFSEADAPVACPACGEQDAKRALSRFACLKGGNGTSDSAGGSCAGCSASSCAGCQR